MKSYLCICFTILFVSSFTHANPSSPKTLEEGHGIGYWWYKDKKEEKEEVVYVVPEPQKEQQETQDEKPEPTEADCKNKESWSVECGFIHPGDDFEFQAKQRDVLLERMVMNAKDQSAVEDFQYYMRWMVQNAIEVARTWQFNRIQNPDLDPNALYPVSQIGLRLAAELKTGQAEEIYSYIRENGGLFYFTKADCIYCHEMATWVQGIAEETGIEIWNTAIDDTCLEGFDNCVTAPETLGPAAALEVKIVPALYMFIEPDIYIRVASGLTTKSSMKGRIINYFNAYRSAAIKGIENSDRWKPSVDFSFNNNVSGSSRLELENLEHEDHDAVDLANKYLESKEKESVNQQ